MRLKETPSAASSAGPSVGARASRSPPPSSPAVPRSRLSGRETVVARIQASTKAPATTARPIAARRSQLMCTRSTTDSREAETRTAPTTSPPSTTRTVTSRRSSPAVSLNRRLESTRPSSRATPNSGRSAVPNFDPDAASPVLSTSTWPRAFVTTMRSSGLAAEELTAWASAALSALAPPWLAVTTSSEMRAARRAVRPSTSVWKSESALRSMLSASGISSARTTAATRYAAARTRRVRKLTAAARRRTRSGSRHRGPCGCTEARRDRRRASCAAS
jgi:hypothetical protein